MNIVNKCYENINIFPKYIYLLNVDKSEKKIIYQKNPSHIIIKNKKFDCYVQDAINNHNENKNNCIVLIDDNNKECIIDDKQINKKILENIKNSRNIMVSIVKINGNYIFMNKKYECDGKIISSKFINEKLLAIIFGTFGAIVFIQSMAKKMI